MICSHCKREFPDSQIDNINGKNYCPFCGRELVESPHTHEVNGRNHPKGTDKSLTVLTALTAVLFVMLVVLLVLPNSSGKASQTVAENTEAPAEDAETPAQDAETPVQDAETPAQDVETPAQDVETPAQDAETPAEDAETPVQDAETPAQDVETPTQDTETPAQEAEAAESTEQEEEHPTPMKPENKTDYRLNGHSYALYDAKKLDLNSYTDVKDFCNEQGGYLAVINSQEENDYLFDVISEKSKKTVFFGYSDEESEGNWTWANGTSNYRNWTRTDDVFQPDNGSGYTGGDEDYAEFNYERGTDCPNDGTWNDAPFRDNTDLFLCEWDYEWDLNNDEQ